MTKKDCRKLAYALYKTYPAVVPRTVPVNRTKLETWLCVRTYIGDVVAKTMERKLFYELTEGGPK